MRKLILILALLSPSALFAQTAARFDLPVLTTTPATTPPGNQPPLYAVINATVNVCGYPATMSGGVCTNKITTYTDATLASACPSTAQLTAPGTSICISTTGLQGALGFWYNSAAQSHLTYTVSTKWGNFGPYDIDPNSYATNQPLTLQHNGTNNASQITLNLEGSTGLAITNPSGGNVLFTPSFQSLTTTGTTGAATLSGGVLNVPNYSAGSSGVTSLNSLTGALSLTGDSTITVTPSGSSIALHATGTGGTSSGTIATNATFAFTGTSMNDDDTGVLSPAITISSFTAPASGVVTFTNTGTNGFKAGDWVNVRYLTAGDWPTPPAPVNIGTGYTLFQVLSTGLSATQFAINVGSLAVSACASGCGSVHTAMYNFPFRVANAVGMPSTINAQTVMTLGNPVSIVGLATNYTSLFHSISPAVTGKPGYLIITDWNNDASNCATAASIESAFGTVFADAHTDGWTVVVGMADPLHGNLVSCSNVYQIRQAVMVWMWGQGKTDANLASGQYWDILSDFGPMISDTSNTALSAGNALAGSGIALAAQYLANELFTGNSHPLQKWGFYWGLPSNAAVGETPGLMYAPTISDNNYAFSVLNQAGSAFVLRVGTSPAMVEAANLTVDGTCTGCGATLPSGTANQLLYYAASGTTVTPLTLGANLSITSGTLNAAGIANPMTTLGDVIYGGTSGAPTRLAGSTSASTLCLTQTGTGTASAAPAWGACNSGAAGITQITGTSTVTGAITFNGGGVSQSGNTFTFSGGGSSGPYLKGASYYPENSATQASITSSTSISVAVHDLVVVFCRAGGSTAPTAITTTDSLTNVWHALTLQMISATLYVQESWSYITTAGSATFTCTPSVSAPYQSMAVLDFAGTTGTLLNSEGAPLSSGATWAPFQTTFVPSARSLVVACAGVDGSPSAWEYINIDGGAATLGAVSGSSLVRAADSACAYRVEPYALPGDVSSSYQISQAFTSWVFTTAAFSY